MTAPASLAELRPGDTWEDLARALLAEVERLVLRVERLEDRLERGAWRGDLGGRVASGAHSGDSERLEQLRGELSSSPGESMVVSVDEAAYVWGFANNGAGAVLARLAAAGLVRLVREGYYDLSDDGLAVESSVENEVDDEQSPQSRHGDRVELLRRRATEAGVDVIHIPQVAEWLSLSAERTRHLLAEMASDGLLHRVGAGFYGFAEESRTRESLAAHVASEPVESVAGALAARHGLRRDTATIAAKLYEAAQSSSRGLSATVAAERLGVTRRQASLLLGRLQRTGVLRRLLAGRYEFAPLDEVAA